MFDLWTGDSSTDTSSVELHDIPQLPPRLSSSNHRQSTNPASTLLRFRRRQFLDNVVDHCGSLSCPLFDCHRSIADDVLAHDMLDVLHIAPTIGITVLQPNKRSSDVGRTVLNVVHDDRLFAPGRHEDLDRFVVIPIGALIERALNGGGQCSV